MTLLRPSLAVLFGTLALAACAAPERAGPSGGVALSFTPPPSLASFSGLVVEQIQAQVFRSDPAQETRVKLFDRTFPFDVNRNTLNLALSIELEAAAETLDVELAFQTAQGRTLFLAGLPVEVIRGGTVNPGTLPAPVYIGPGSNAAFLSVSPQNPVVVAGGSLDFAVNATDANQAPVDTVYVKWRASGGRINALGHLTAPSAAGTIFVVATTPDSVRDSTQVTVLPVGAAALTGRVVDGNNQAGLAGATVLVLDAPGNPVATVQTAADGSYSTPALAPGIYSLVVSLNGFVTTTLFDATVSSGATTVPTIPLAPVDAKTGDLAGEVFDATNGNSIPSATVELRSGVNATTGQPLASFTADGQGLFSLIRLPAGTYTLRAVASGYVAGTRTSVVLGGRSLTGQDLVLSPIGTNNVRIVLTWDSLPQDLDAHLTGPDTAPGLPRFHVYYSNQGSLTARPYASLDLDNTTSFGPETITIGKQFAGIYRYSVHDFDNAGSTGSTALAGSGAKVVLYINGALAQQFFVPNQPGTLWTVFELNGSTVTALNRMSDQANSDSVAIRLPGGQGPSGAATDADLIRRVVRAHPKQ